MMVDSEIGSTARTYVAFSTAFFVSLSKIVLGRNLDFLRRLGSRYGFGLRRHGRRRDRQTIALSARRLLGSDFRRRRGQAEGL
jgi:hypothetical protein